MQKYKDMSEAQQAIVKTFMLVLVVIIALVLWDTASATGKNNTINNYYEVTEVTEVSSTNYSGKGLFTEFITMARARFALKPHGDLKTPQLCGISG